MMDRQAMHATRQSFASVLVIPLAGLEFLGIVAQFIWGPSMVSRTV
jgi:hypothetical protein